MVKNVGLQFNMQNDIHLDPPPVLFVCLLVCFLFFLFFVEHGACFSSFQYLYCVNFVLFDFILCFVPNVASVSGLSIRNCPFDFL